MSKHYNGFNITTRNSILNFIISNRNFGKTWTFKKRAFKRAFKKGKKTIWIRRFKKEAKEATAKFFTSSDLQKFCGIEMYNPNTKKGNCKKEGNVFYVKRGGRWTWFLQVIALSDVGSMRGVDDIDIDTIVFDEYRTTADKYSRYHGNEINDFLDIFFSVKREHSVKCFLLGNKEYILDPYFSYFKIPAFPDSYEGVRSFKKGSISVEIVNNTHNTESEEYGQQLFNMLDGTSYGNFIFKSETKGKRGVKIADRPKDALLYVQLCINSQYIRIFGKAGAYYVCEKVDESIEIYSNIPINKPRHFTLTNRLRRYFTAFKNAYEDNTIYYSSHKTAEIIRPFLAWLNLK